MLKKLDKWLLDTAYQGLVNVTQRQPSWWVEQSAIGMLVTAVLRAALRPEPMDAWLWFGLFVDMFIAGVFFMASRNSALLASLGADERVRPILLLLSILFLPFLLLKAPGMMLIHGLHDLAFLSMYYFAGCKPPPPPKPRTKLALNNSGA